MKNLNRMQTKSLDEVLQYIFDAEMEDFSENPSDNHVYYHAVIVESGLREAQEVLRDAIKNLTKDK